jgi:hypothetical protein
MCDYVTRLNLLIIVSRVYINLDSQLARKTAGLDSSTRGKVAALI